MSIRRNAHDPAIERVRRPVAQLVSDGVVAAYVHDISGRHRARRRDRPAPRVRRRVASPL